jgi:hypothetical protein
MRDHLRITLSYSGKDVDDGSMSLEDLVPVLQGFSSAYGKVSADSGILTQHRLRLVGLKHSSADLLLEVWKAVGDNSSELQAIGSLVQAAMAVVTGIVVCIQLKKHVKDRPYSTGIDGNRGLVIVSNGDNATIAVPPNDFRRFKDKLIDQDLSKITKPIEQGKIDSASIIVDDGDQPPISETITFRDKPYFEVEEKPTTTTKESWLTGMINTMTKSTNGGFVYLNDGTRVSFHVVCDQPEQYWHLFSHRGMVKMRAVAYMDENLKPTSLDVYEMIPMQPDLPFTEAARV